MILSKTLIRAVVFTLLAFPAAIIAAYDVLELPAVPSKLASKSLLYTVVKFGDRYFATGHRGHIIYSDDGGASWTQAEVPVRSAILDIHFPTPDKGWAVGHAGVILHSADGGKTWTKQFDGNQYGQQGLEYYQEKLAADPDSEILQLLVEEMQFAVEQGADKPFFVVRFHTEEFGHAVGAYGMVLATWDGGKTWIPRMETVENYGFSHLFDFAQLGKDRFVFCGEMGVVLLADISAEDISKRGSVEVNSPWDGSFFSCTTATDGAVVMGGLRGKVFRTEDVESWTKVKKPESSSIVDSIVLSDGRVVLAGQGGDLLVSSDNGKTFSKLTVKENVERINAIAEGESGTLLIAGPRGIQTLNIE